jgi:hypothetical protein
VETLIPAGVKVGELPLDHESGRWTGGNAVAEPQGASAGNRDAGRTLLHVGQGKDALRQTFPDAVVRRLLVQLGMRIGWGRRRPWAGTLW